ncbi:MAG: hypothetical protein ABI844_18420 [Saprospiraceae bacterium]
MSLKSFDDSANEQLPLARIYEEVVNEVIGILSENEMFPTLLIRYNNPMGFIIVWSILTEATTINNPVKGALMAVRCISVNPGKSIPYVLDSSSRIAGASILVGYCQFLLDLVTKW